MKKISFVFMKFFFPIAVGAFLFMDMPIFFLLNSYADGAVCGNGIIEVGEDCDNGVNNSDVAPDG